MYAARLRRYIKYVMFRTSALFLCALLIPATADLPSRDGVDGQTTRLSYPDIPKAAAWERAQWHVQKRLGEGMDRLPMNALEPARRAMHKMDRSHAPTRFDAGRDRLDAANPSAWTALGPFQKGGRTRRIVFGEDGLMFAAGVSGGVWRSTRGQAWTPLGDRLTNVNVGALVMSPADPAVMYAGTGELYRRTNRPYANMTGAGIFKTTNGGEDWVQLTATMTEDFAYVSDIVISPNDAQRLYAATNTGVWRSDDGGVTFVQTLATDEGGGDRFEGCTDLAIRPDLAWDWVIATCSSRSTDDRYWLPGLLPTTCGGPCDGRIYLNRAAGAGDDWQVTLSEAGMGRTSVALFAGDPAVVYALAASNRPGPDKNGDGVGDYDNGLHAVFRSNDGGRTWRPTLRNTDTHPVSTWILSFGWQARTDGQTPYGAGWYNQAIVVDPENPDVVWAGGMQLYRSDDGGRTFGLMSNYFEDGNNFATRAATMHPDIHTLVFSPEGDLWIGNDGGVWLWQNGVGEPDFENDGYNTHITDEAVFSPRVEGYTTTQFYHGSVSPDGSLVIGGMQDNGTDALNLPGALGGGWIPVYGGDGAYSAYDPDGPYYYFSAQGPSLSRVDGNFEYTALGPLLSGAAPGPGDFMFITPYILDPTDASILYAGGKRLYRGTANGDQWAIASAPFGPTFHDKANALAAAPSRPGRVLIGTGRAIYRNDAAKSSGQGAVLSSTSPRDGWVSSLAFDPNDARIAYATYSTLGGQHVWKSENGGARFFPIDGEGPGRLPDVPVHSLAVHPVDPDQLYIGTDLGVFFTGDGGRTWQVEETGFGGTIVERVAINRPRGPGTAYLFAFTYGRGVWRAPLAEVDGRPPFEVTPAVNGFWYDAGEPGHGLQVQLINQGGEIAALVAWYVYDQGRPMWMIGVGSVHRDRIVADMTVTRGADFGAALDPDDVIREPWGTLELVFADEDRMSLRWQSDRSGGQAGTLATRHLSRSSDVSPPGSVIGLCSSGSYWNPAQSGQGLLVDTVRLGDEPGLAWSWYSYRDGAQLWLVGSAPIVGNRVVSDAFAGRVGEFPPRYRAADAVVEPWGTVTFDFTGPGTFTLSWDPVAQPEPPGSEDFEQLTALGGLGCEP